MHDSPTPVPFPTPLHQSAAAVVVDFFGQQPQTDTVLLVNSCARGKATPESDLDVAVLVAERVGPGDLEALSARWQAFSGDHPVIAGYKRSHRFAQVHLDVIDGVYAPPLWDDGGGPDDFEVALGNHLRYSLPLGEAGPHFKTLQSRWLPYYGEPLRTQRLDMVRQACAYDLDHVPFFVRRKLYFQAFDRLYKAFREFLQALFIRHRCYPVAYNKWIREQVEEILQLPDLYPVLPEILSVGSLESDALNGKATILQKLLDEYAGA